MNILPNDKTSRSRRPVLTTVPRSRVTNTTALAAIAKSDARRRAAFQPNDETMGDLWAQITGALSPIFGSVGGSISGQVQPTVSGQVGGSVSGSGLNVGGSVVGQVQPNAREVVIEIKGDPADGWSYTETEWIKTVLSARGWDIRNVGQVNSTTYRVTAMVGKQYSDAQILTNARNHLSDKGMAVTGVAIVQASQATYVSGNADSSGGDGTNASGISSMLAGAALGLGVSTTVLMIGGATVAIFLLRRR